MLSLVRRAVRSDFGRGVTAVASGSAAAQVLTFSVAPLLARLYTPAQFGVLGTFLAISGAFALVATLRLESAVVVATGERAARRTLVSAIAIVAVTTAIATVVVIAVALLSPSSPDRGWLVTLPFLPLAVAFVGVYNASLQWLARRGRFRVIALANIVRSASMNGWQLLAGLFAPSATNLVLGYALGQLGGAWLALRGAVRVSPRLLREQMGPRDVGRLVRQQQQFTVFHSLQALVSHAHTALPIVLLGFWFDAPIVGHFVMAHRLLLAPVALVGESIRSVIYPLLAREAAHDLSTAQRSMRRVSIGLSLPLVLALPVAAVTAPTIFSWLLGPDWRITGEFASFMAVWIGSLLANVPAISMIPILDMQRWFLGFTVVHVTVSSLGLIVGGVLGAPTLAIALYSITNAALNAVLILIVDRRLAGSVARRSPARPRGSGPLP